MTARGEPATSPPSGTVPRRAPDRARRACGRRAPKGLPAAALLALAGATGPAWAQGPVPALRGVVTDTAGTPVAFALVRVVGATSEQFTGPRGGFAAAGLAAGTYRVQVRQVGFQPFDSAVTVATGAPPLRVVLRPLAIRLEDLTVAAPGRCTAPGAPDSGTSPELAVIFAQLSENARRYAILADSYPFLFFVERTFNELADNGEVAWSATDTVVYRSDSRGRYRPGEIIDWSASGPRWPERTVRLPTLPDLADSAFHATHCFALEGVHEQNGARLLRVSFRAADRLRMPDIDGEADLDAETFQLRHLRFRLTRPERAVARLVSLEGSMTLLTLHPNIVIPGTIRSSQVSGPSDLTRAGWPPPRYLEYQRLVRVQFLRPLPADSAPSP